MISRSTAAAWNRTTKTGRVNVLKALISIKSTQRLDDGDDTTELITEGDYELTDTGCVMTYEETDATGYEGSDTVVTMETGKSLQIVRTGNIDSELFIEVGKENYCLYGTPYGDINVSVSAEKIVSKIDENGGNIFAKYSIDVNSQSMGKFALHIKIKPLIG